LSGRITGWGGAATEVWPAGAIVALVVGSVGGRMAWAVVRTVVLAVGGASAWALRWPRTGSCVLAHPLIGARALRMAWRWVSAWAWTWIATGVRAARPATLGAIIALTVALTLASAVPLKVPPLIALAALWPVPPGPWPRPVIDRPRRRFGGFQSVLGQQRRQCLGLHALQRAEVGHRQRGTVEVSQQSQPGLALLLMPSLLCL